MTRKHVIARTCLVFLFISQGSRVSDRGLQCIGNLEILKPWKVINAGLHLCPYTTVSQSWRQLIADGTMDHQLKVLARLLLALTSPVPAPRTQFPKDDLHASLQAASMYPQEGFMTWAQRKQLQALVQRHAPAAKLILNVGFHQGHSAECLLEAATDAKVISFDIDEHKESVAAGELFLRGRYNGRHHLVRGDSTKSLLNFAVEQAGRADVIVIDGGHKFPVPQLDLRWGVACCQPGALVVCDDMHMPDVAQAWEAAIDSGILRPIGEPLRFEGQRSMIAGEVIKVPQIPSSSLAFAGVADVVIDGDALAAALEQSSLDVESLRSTVQPILAQAIDALQHSGAVRLRGVMPKGSEEVPPTPDSPAGNQVPLMWRKLTLALAAAAGEPYSFVGFHGGSLVQSVLPLDEHLHTASVYGSALLPMHREFALSTPEVRCDTLVLVCLRAQGCPNMGRTLVVSSEQVSNLLPPEDLEVLAKDDALALCASFAKKPWLRPAVEGESLNVFDEQFVPTLELQVHADVAEAWQRLRAAALALAQPVELASGDALIINNTRALHGREAFSEKSHGERRWLTRAYARSSLPPQATEERLLRVRYFAHEPLAGRWENLL